MFLSPFFCLYYQPLYNVNRRGKRGKIKSIQAAAYNGTWTVSNLNTGHIFMQFNLYVHQTIQFWASFYKIVTTKYKLNANTIIVFLLS